MNASTKATYSYSWTARVEVVNGSAWEAAAKTGSEHDALLFNIISLMLCCVLLIHLLLRLRLHFVPERCALCTAYCWLVCRS